MTSGYFHGDRGVGVRHHQLILPSVVCSTHVARRIAQAVGGVTFSHQHGCGIIGEDVEGIEDFFADLADHPNVGSVLIVGLGCETIQGQELGSRLSAKNESTRYQIIQESGGVNGTVESGIESANALLLRYPRMPAELSNVLVGIDIAEQNQLQADLCRAIQEKGMKVRVTTHCGSSIDNFSELMREKAQVIISFPDANQPASGFPLIPVINIASEITLHMATKADFDLGPEADVDAILSALQSTIEGVKTKSEINGSGEIRAPRLVRSV